MDTKVAVNWVVLIVAALGSSMAMPEIYRWTDAQGRVHFGDRPKSEKAERLQIKRQPSPAPISPAKAEAQERADQQRLIDAFREEREAREVRRKTTAENEARRSQQCAHARNRLQRYRGNRLYQPLEDGGKRYLNDAERDEEIAKAESEIERWCDR